MKECEILSTCIFFNETMTNMPALTSLYKQKYCKGDFSICARYQVMQAVGRSRVPADLFPNEIERVGYIVGPRRS
jgi:hypothetical protein